MKPLLTIAVAGAIALGIGLNTNIAEAGNQPPKVELCHFNGHMSEIPVPPHDPRGDHVITGVVGHGHADCEDRGGKVMSVPCPALKGHINLPHEIIDRFCEIIG